MSPLFTLIHPSEEDSRRFVEQADKILTALHAEENGAPDRALAILLVALHNMHMSAPAKWQVVLEAYFTEQVAEMVERRRARH